MNLKHNIFALVGKANKPCTSLLRAFQRYQKQTERGGKRGEEVVMAWFSRVKACSHPNKTNKQYIQTNNVGVDFVNEPCKS